MFLEPGGLHPERKPHAPGGHPPCPQCTGILLCRREERFAHPAFLEVSAPLLVAVNVDAVDEVEAGPIDVRVLDRTVLDHAALDAVVVHGELSAQPVVLLAAIHPLPALRARLLRVIRPVFQAKTEEVFVPFVEVENCKNWLLCYEVRSSSNIWALSV